MSGIAGNANRIIDFYIFFLYFTKLICIDYQKGLPFGSSQNKIMYFTSLLCITIGQYSIPSTISRLVIFLIFCLLLLLFYTLIGIHNQKTHSGNLLLFFQKEVRKAQICLCIGIGLLLFALLLLHFTE